MKHEGIALVWAQCRAAAAALGGWIGYFLGGTDGLLTALVIFSALDYVTGVLCAVMDRSLSSAVGFRGICRKMMIFLLVGLGHILDVHVAGSGAAVRTAVICFYLANEGLSILENAARLGLPVPGRLKAALEQLHSGSEKEDTAGGGERG